MTVAYDHEVYKIKDIIRKQVNHCSNIFMGKRRYIYISVQIALLVLLCLTFAVSITFDYAAPSLFAIIREEPNVSLFDRLPSLSTKYHIEANASVWGHAIMWRLSYILMGISIIIICMSSCLPMRFNVLFRKETLISIGFLFLYNMNYIANIIWVISTSFEQVWLMLAFALLMTYSLYGALAFSYKDLYDQLATLEASNKIMLWGTRIVIHNVIALYATWLSLIWPLNLSLSLSYFNSFSSPTAVHRGGLTVSESSTLGLVIILIEMLVWFTIENFLVEPYCRYTLTVYPVVILTMWSIVARVSTTGGINLVLASMLLAIAVIEFGLRLLLVILRSWKSLRRGSELPINKDTLPSPAVQNN